MDDTFTITRTPAPRVTLSVFSRQSATVRHSSWGFLPQEVVSYGSPSDAGEGGRIAVRKNAGALRRLRDS